MRADSIVTNVRALMRAHTILAEIKARHFLTRSGIAGFAALIGAFGVIMLGLAVFFALEQAWGRIWAAVAIGAAGCVLALILLLVARYAKPGRDLELAREVQKSAIEGLLADGRAIEAEIADFKNAFRHPVDSILPNIIVPLAGIILNTLKKKTDKPPGPDPQS